MCFDYEMPEKVDQKKAIGKEKKTFQLQQQSKSEWVEEDPIPV